LSMWVRRSKSACRAALPSVCSGVRPRSPSDSPPNGVLWLGGCKATAEIGWPRVSTESADRTGSGASGKVSTSTFATSVPCCVVKLCAAKGLRVPHRIAKLMAQISIVPLNAVPLNVVPHRPPRKLLIAEFDPEYSTSITQDSTSTRFKIERLYNQMRVDTKSVQQFWMIAELYYLPSAPPSC